MGSTEVVDVVDSRDMVLRRATLGECLRRGLLHRSVAVVVLRRNARLMLQQRSYHDKWHPGRWTLSSTGHVRAGESYAVAAERELWEELGLAGHLAGVGKVFLPKIRSRDMVEWEVTAVFTCRTEFVPVIDRSELERVEIVSKNELRSMMKGRLLTPDARIILRTLADLI